MMTFDVPVPPPANRWHRHVGNRVLLSSTARAYLKDLPFIARAQGVRPLEGDVAVSIVWYREAKRGDTDKRGGILLDALQGIAYADDKQVADYRIIRDDSDRAHPRMVVTITPLKAAS